ncbi:hypothetical protein VC35_13285 [Pseudomonas fluorescens]|uniref:Uncharacterized protein n=1 Tax=Pseudomonas fluorescens TaxID=294 RepID=A0A0F4TQ09_PSEFL|nr:hypothetical protein VC35_13285 [Pseudomonas fluorescens]
MRFVLDAMLVPDSAIDVLGQVDAQAYFDQDSLTVEMVRYFHDHDNPIDPFADDTSVAVPPKLIKEMGFYLVRVSRTWDKVFSWGRATCHRDSYQADSSVAQGRTADVRK